MTTGLKYQLKFLQNINRWGNRWSEASDKKEGHDTIYLKETGDMPGNHKPPENQYNVTRTGHENVQGKLM